MWKECKGVHFDAVPQLKLRSNTGIKTWKSIMMIMMVTTLPATTLHVMPYSQHTAVTRSPYLYPSKLYTTTHTQPWSILLSTYTRFYYISWKNKNKNYKFPWVPKHRYNTELLYLKKMHRNHMLQMSNICDLLMAYLSDGKTSYCVLTKLGSEIITLFITLQNYCRII